MKKKYFFLIFKIKSDRNKKIKGYRYQNIFRIENCYKFCTMLCIWINMYLFNKSQLKINAKMNVEL